MCFVGAGIEPDEVANVAAANRINFSPQIRAPKLLLMGRYDEDSPLESRAKPMFNLFREPKRLQLYEGGHIPPQDVLVPAVKSWLDETLGPVAQ